MSERGLVKKVRLRVQRRIIAKLKQGCRSKEELIKIYCEIAQSTSEAARKWIERYVEDLEALELVSKERDRGNICWYFYNNCFENLNEYKLKQKHSEQLIPAIGRLTETFLQDLLIRGNTDQSRVSLHLGNETVSQTEVQSARKHLAHYGKIEDLVNDLERERHSTERERLFISLQTEITRLIFRIRSGEPLLGSCDTCPMVFIRK
ncbi:MAG TPA: hypothetical protein VN739_07310 [Nitrososphaerales archaeon]|nr:hypothetical protein [Nitrososphaerales archaeon]